MVLILCFLIIFRRGSIHHAHLIFKTSEELSFTNEGVKIVNGMAPLGMKTLRREPMPLLSIHTGRHVGNPEGRGGVGEVGVK
ncbi:MAG: hypothetical protein EA362_08915 [Saprospirales bacterium]|nr:MAG: hypothetical protein EA362_08915 [Saprospirales bacterium]